MQHFGVCNDRRWNETKNCAYLMFTKKHPNKMTSGENESAQFCQVKQPKQKIITHKTQVGKGCLSMILNQRQRTTPASD
jgi:hypothetical protein